jgi:hypothetical protein
MAERPLAGFSRDDTLRPEQFAGDEFHLLPDRVLLPEGPVADQAVVIAEGGLVRSARARQ